MKYIFTVLLISITFLSLKSNDDTAQKSALFSSVNEDAIRIEVPNWDLMKTREYNLKEYSLLDNDKSRIFIKVFMAKIKYIKQHINDEGFIAKNNIPLNAETKKIDEKQMLVNLQSEILNLLGYLASDIIDVNGINSNFIIK